LDGDRLPPGIRETRHTGERRDGREGVADDDGVRQAQRDARVSKIQKERKRTRRPERDEKEIPERRRQDGRRETEEGEGRERVGRQPGWLRVGAHRLAWQRRRKFLR